MKKSIILILIVFLLTGCKGVAKITIDNNNISEKVIVTENNQSQYKQIKKLTNYPTTLYYDQKLENPFGNSAEKEKGVNYYDVTNNDNANIITATGSFDFNNHMRSTLVRRCFKYYNILSTNNGTTVFSTSNGLICAFSNFDIVVTTPYKVTKNNASKVNTNSNTYTWNVNSKNRNNVSIYLEIDFTKKADGTSTENNNDNNNNNNNTNNTEKKQNNKTYLIIFITIIPIIILIVAYILKKKKDALDRV